MLGETWKQRDCKVVHLWLWSWMKVLLQGGKKKSLRSKSKLLVSCGYWVQQSTTTMGAACFPRRKTFSSWTKIWASKEGKSWWGATQHGHSRSKRPLRNKKLECNSGLLSVWRCLWLLKQVHLTTKELALRRSAQEGNVQKFMTISCELIALQ